MVSEPVPKRPTKSAIELVQEEPAPVTVTVPCEPVANAIKPFVLLTVPPFAMVSAPVPLVPTESRPLLVQVEPAPVTVAVPCEPAPLPMSAPERFNVPLFWMVSEPVADVQTSRMLPTAAPPDTTVGLGVMVFRHMVPAVGTTPVFQLLPVNQSVDVAPVQFVCA